MGHRDTLLCDTTYPNATSARSATRERVRRKAASLCAGHVQQLGGANPLPDLMEVRVSKNARAIAVRRGLKEAWSKCASRWTRIGYKALASGERATYREAHIHQEREA
jgi:hypothetical protein